MTYILLYLLAVNLLLFAVMGIDKYKAKHQLWRIPERTLFVLAAIGGSLGGIWVCESSITKPSTLRSFTSFQQS